MKLGARSSYQSLFVQRLSRTLRVMVVSSQRHRTSVSKCPFPVLPARGRELSWEVLKGVGVDGAGGNLPFFFAFFAGISPFLAGISPFFGGNLRSFALYPRTRGKQPQFTGKMGNFTPTPSAPTPLRASRLFDPVASRRQGRDGHWEFISGQK